MHEQAEYGIAAHWLYKKSGGSSASKTNDAQRLDDQINWLKHSLDWQRLMRLRTPRNTCTR